MAFVLAPSLPLQRPPPARRRRPAPRMCSRGRNPQSVDELPTPVRIALTRENGKNGPLRAAVSETFPDAEVMELPCVQTVPGEDRDALPERLAAREPGWVVVTSPEAAAVFVAAWRKARCPPIGRLAAVGKATGDALRAVGLDVDFQPSKATGKTLAKEFPDPAREGEPVLYPASAKASRDVVDGLTARGFAVLRLNTYSTQCATLTKDHKYLAKDVHIVTFASPSAVKGWVANVGVADNITVACIGETSARAARTAGFRQVHHPERPGIEGWISAICEAMKVYEVASLQTSRKE